MDNLKKLRKERNLSLKALGEKLGVAESTVSLYENGKREPDNNTMKKMADYFNVTIDYLLGVSQYNLRSEMVKTMNNKGLTIDEFAKEIGISVNRIKTIIKGDNPSLKEVDAICDVIKIDFFECIGASRDWHLNLKNIRIEKGKTIDDIAKLFQDLPKNKRMPNIRYQQIELGEKRPSYKELSTITNFLNVNIYDLLGIASQNEIDKNSSSSSDEDDELLKRICSLDEITLLNDYKGLSTQGKEYIRQTMMMAKTTYKKDNMSSNLGVG